MGRRSYKGAGQTGGERLSLRKTSPKLPIAHAPIDENASIAPKSQAAPKGLTIRGLSGQKLSFKNNNGPLLPFTVAQLEITYMEAQVSE